jgi:hypothetical protein
MRGSSGIFAPIPCIKRVAHRVQNQCELFLLVQRIGHRMLKAIIWSPFESAEDLCFAQSAVVRKTLPYADRQLREARGPISVNESYASHSRQAIVAKKTKPQIEAAPSIMLSSWVFLKRLRPTMMERAVDGLDHVDEGADGNHGNQPFEAPE